MATSYWKVWLRENLLTKDVDNDYIAEVSTGKDTLRNEDIARRIVEEGSEIKYDTLLSVIARVPGDLAAGRYTLRIVTRFSNSAILLKEPRVVEYERTLTVGP